MRDEIRTRLDDQFKTPTLQKLVRDAAADSTKTAAEPLIRTEVTKQVKDRVDAEKPTIAAAVTQQTNAAVKQMGPQIDSLVKNTVDSKIATSVEPTVERVKSEADLQLLITRMDADDAIAFDNLLSLSRAGDPAQQSLIISALRSVFNAHNAGMFQVHTFKIQQTDEQLIGHLSDTDSFSRAAALDALRAKRNLTLLPRTVDMMRSDSSIDVRCAAYRAFNAWTGQSFQCLDVDGTTNWWLQNRQSYSTGQ